MTTNFNPAGRAALLFSCAVLVLAGCANPTTAESAGPRDPDRELFVCNCPHGGRCFER